MRPKNNPREPASFDQLCEALIAGWPLYRFAEVTTMVAVSGGADSVGLLRALTHLLRPDARGRLVVLHYNHRLREEHSEADERFVAELAESLGLECEIERAADLRLLPQRTRHETVDEASLRAARYAFFDAAAHRRGARYVVTAHTADDNVETVLHHLFRGTGPAGIAGMPRFRELGADVVLARPLLAVRRELICAALTELGQAWREDQSNLDPRWQRNWIRGSLLPEIRSRYPEAEQAISRLVRQQSEALDWLAAAAAEWSSERLQTAPGGPLRIELSPRALPPRAVPPRALLIAALRQAWDDCGWPRGAMAERHWNGVAALIAAAAEPASPLKSINLPGSLRAQIADPVR